MEEVRLGHLQGPVTKQQIDERFGKDAWLFAKRFALIQGAPENPKVRVIDDCRRSGLNTSYTVSFKLELLDLEVLSAIAMSLKSGMVDLGGNHHKLVSPSVVGKVWHGRTLDLSKAYKQLPIRTDSKS